MFNKPYDIVWVITIVGLVVATMGFGLESVMDAEYQALGVGDNDLRFFNNATNYMESGDFVKGTADDASDALAGDVGVDTETSEDSILTQGFNSMLSLGQTYKAAEGMMTEGTRAIGIDTIYWLSISSAIIITMFIIIYTWIRGR